MELNVKIRVTIGLAATAAVLAIIAIMGDGPSNPDRILMQPGKAGILGTLPDGRDLLRSLCTATARGLLWSGLATSLTMLIGSAIGIAAAEMRDRIVDRTQSVFGAVLDSIGPFVICACVASVIPGLGAPGLVLLIALVSWPSVAVAVRKEILSTKRKSYYDAAVSLGLAPVKLFLRHVLPNVAERIVPLGFAMCAAFLGLFGALDFVGVGARTSSQLGAMIYDSMGYMDAAPWYFWSTTSAFGLALFSLAGIAASMRRVFGGASYLLVSPRRR